MAEIIKLEHPLVFIFGPSSSGKDTVIQELLKSYTLNFPPTLTTRGMRPGEKPGIYNFIREEKFKELISSDAFIEYDEHFGNYYGTSKELIVKAMKDGLSIKQIDMNGINKIFNSKDLGYNRETHTINIDNKYLAKIYFVAITMESVKITRERLINRDGDGVQTQNRISELQKEYDFAKKHSDYRIVNPFNHPEKAAEGLSDLLQKLDDGI